MEEEVNEDELNQEELEEIEERFYAMIHYGDDTQANVDQSVQKPTQDVPNAGAINTVPQVRRYWHTSADTVSVINPYAKLNNPYAKVNNQNKVSNTHQVQNNLKKNNISAKLKEEKTSSPPKSPQTSNRFDATIFQTPPSQNTKTTIQILDNDEVQPAVELETSDEDEVIEVELPPKLPICIESSDEDDADIIHSPNDNELLTSKANKEKPKTSKESNGDSGREKTASPVPSIVSSASDEFIRGDCIALNITSHHLDKHSFDFSLHGSDVLETPSKKKKKKKNKDREKSLSVDNNITATDKDKQTSEIFATPKNKSKSKRQKNKSNDDIEQSIAIIDIGESGNKNKKQRTKSITDSDQKLSAGGIPGGENKSKKPKAKSYMVSELSLPNADVYDSDSNQSGSDIKKIDTDLTNANTFISDSSQSDGQKVISISFEKTDTVCENGALTEKPTKENPPSSERSKSLPVMNSSILKPIEKYGNVQPDNNITTPDKNNETSEIFVTPKNKSKSKRQKNKSNANLEQSITIIDIAESGSKNKKQRMKAITDSEQKLSAEGNPGGENKSKKPKAKSYMVCEQSLPNADIYASDSNQSSIDVNEKKNDTEISNANPFELDSSQSDSQKNISKSFEKSDTECENGALTENPNKEETPSSKKSKSLPIINTSTPKPIENSGNMQPESAIIDLTAEIADDIIIVDTTGLEEEDIVIGNVTGFDESDDYGDASNVPISESSTTMLGSTKQPAILFENLDFDHLKGYGKQRKHFSLKSIREDMDKFYNNSWGGENFNHREIQKSMSRDKNLWAIDARDRMPTPNKRKVVCNFCNRTGHRDEACRMKPPVCHMCGNAGHYEPRCPNKVCLKCGSPYFMFSSSCRSCAGWGRVACVECGEGGHPASHCPDLWRRYHNTTDNTTPLAKNLDSKPYYQKYCSGCTRKGHLVHECRSYVPFSGLPISSPYVARYNPVYPPLPLPLLPNLGPPQNKPNYPPKGTPATGNSKSFERNKRQSKSPTAHETHANKKRNVSENDIVQTSEVPKRLVSKEITSTVSLQRMRQVSENEASILKSTNDEVLKKVDSSTEKAADYIPITSSSPNHDKKGQMIQDSEVSDTSDAVTSARIYVSKEIIEKLQESDGQDWLKEKTQTHNVTITHSNINLFLNIVGKMADQEAFETELRDWASNTSNANDTTQINDEENQFIRNIPKNRFTLQRKLTKALDSLKDDLGDPKAIYKELNYLQNNHDKLLKCKVISPRQLSNNRTHIKDMLFKLNVLLVGQAGLADGVEHVKELRVLLGKINSLRQKKVPSCMRSEIGEHYHSVFTDAPRDDYSALLMKYYDSNSKKQRVENSPKFQQKVKKVITPIKFPQKSGIVQSPMVKKPPVSKTMNELAFFRKRLMDSRPASADLKKARMDLVRKLHIQISSLNSRFEVSSKAKKKIRKIKEQSLMFLNNV